MLSLTEFELATSLLQPVMQGLLKLNTVCPETSKTKVP